MAKKELMRLTRAQQSESLDRYTELYRDTLMEHVNWRKKHENAVVIIKDEEFKQKLKDIIAELDAVANAIIDNDPRLKLAE